MSAKHSRLSLFDYDIVVATTQKYINLTMDHFLKNLKAPEVVMCYVFDAKDNLVLISYEDLKAKAADPFGVPDGADPATNPDLVKLQSDAVNFAGAFKARIGLPPMNDLADIPPVLTLQAGDNAAVIFNLLCAEFEVASLVYKGRHPTWLHQKQPKGTPWYFQSSVSLASSPIDLESKNHPPAVQQRIEQLNTEVGAGAFGVQQLFLELDSVLKNPTIPNIPPTLALHDVIVEVFVDAYIKQMKQDGKPILGYTATVNRPDNSTLRLGAISRECSMLLDPNGKPIANPTPTDRMATTLNYLGTVRTTPPTPRAFPWNWVESGELDEFAGVQSVPRTTLVNLLVSLVAGEVANLCITPSFEFVESKSGLWVLDNNMKYSGSPDIALGDVPKRPVARKESVKLADFSFTPESCETTASILALDIENYYAKCEYSLQGSLLAGIDDCDVPFFTVRFHAVCVFEAGHWETGFAYYHEVPSQPYVDYAIDVTFQIDVGPDGNLRVNNPKPNITNKSYEPYKWYVEGLYTFAQPYLDPIYSTIVNTCHQNVNNLLQNFSQDLETSINRGKAWVFPGGKTFSFSKVTLSDFQDLIAYVNYVDPS